MPKKKKSMIIAIKWTNPVNNKVEVYPLNKEGKHIKKMPKSPRSVYSKINPEKKVAKLKRDVDDGNEKREFMKFPEFVNVNKACLTMDDFDLEAMTIECKMNFPDAIFFDQNKSNIFSKNIDDNPCHHNLNDLYFLTHNDDQQLSFIL